MSHTQFYIDSGRVVYKVVVDNLFYTNLTDIQANSHDDVGIIDDFTRRYPVGSSVEACGKVSKSGGNFALHFVHPSACDKVKFNGFLHINGQDVTANQRYCGNCGCKVSYN
jgi:hypothetical protein